jgi:hypothetical protein
MRWDENRECVNRKAFGLQRLASLCQRALNSIISSHKLDLQRRVNDAETLCCPISESKQKQKLRRQRKVAKKYFKSDAIYKQLSNGQDRLNPHRGGSGSFRRHYLVHMLVLGHPGPLSNLASRLLLWNRKVIVWDYIWASELSDSEWTFRLLPTPTPQCIHHVKCWAKPNPFKAKYYIIAWDAF